ncbi:MAG: lysophospholipid acyltransferase family protein [Candidatus Gracilibacteria bacterium]|nr:lysophospholipid acyltransferase family protein [Candidatus Gracilibacteria bacterium]
MKILLFFTRLVLSIRYKVTLKGVENLKHNGPILILPNHVALVDPRIFMAFLGKYIIVSPLASEKYYNLPILKQVMNLAGAVSIGEISAGANPDDVKKVFSSVVEGLKEGKNLLIYPSGQIYRQNFESIKGKQITHFIVNNMPENTKVLLVRQRGLWGSMRSKAWDNGKTTFFDAYKKGIKYAFANLLFFVPKRDVDIEIFDFTDEINKQKKNSLNDFNKYLENFYNQKPDETLRYIKHYFYFDDVKDKKEPAFIDGSEKELLKVNDYDLSQISDQVKLKIKEKISLIKSIDISLINDDSKLVLDLFFDSLDMAEIKSYVQANFDGASNPPITDLKTVGDLYVMAVGKSTSVEKLKECDWGMDNLSVNLLIEKFTN